MGDIYRGAARQRHSGSLCMPGSLRGGPLLYPSRRHCRLRLWLAIAPSPSIGGHLVFFLTGRRLQEAVCREQGAAGGGGDQGAGIDGGPGGPSVGHRSFGACRRRPPEGFRMGEPSDSVATKAAPLGHTQAERHERPSAFCRRHAPRYF